MEQRGSIIYLEDITVSFDGFRALNGVDFYVDHGEIRALIGPNGAGKTTLLDVICGKVRPDTARVIFGEKTFLTKSVRYGDGSGTGDFPSG
jgi:urea transport system ATP-binding protein